jgi:hypothetical protein
MRAAVSAPKKAVFHQKNVGALEGRPLDTVTSSQIGRCRYVPLLARWAISSRAWRVS